MNYPMYIMYNQHYHIHQYNVMLQCCAYVIQCHVVMHVAVDHFYAFFTCYFLQAKFRVNEPENQTIETFTNSNTEHNIICIVCQNDLMVRVSACVVCYQHLLQLENYF